MINTTLQVVLLIAAFLILLVGLGKRRTHATKAWKKIALLLLVAGMVVAVLFPELTNAVAHTLGVGRGADLLLYALVVAFVFFAMNNYLHQQDQKDALFRLARKVSLLDAKERYEQIIYQDHNKKS